MNLLKHHTSKLIPLVIVIVIPISMLVAVGYELHLQNLIIKNELSIEIVREILNHKLRIPIAELITFGTVVIPSIMIRKAVREGTHNTFVKSHNKGIGDTEQPDDEETPVV
jgi:hypothetical protein